MKRSIIFIIISLLTTFTSMAQFPGNANDWVQYDKKYYKYSISDDGIYRLYKADLLANGFQESELIGDNFQMFRNGEEVPLYVSTNDAFGSSDFIEFYGQRNNGEADSYLYDNPLNQPRPEISLFKTNSIYFLTINSSNNLRINDINNDLNNLPQKENYFIDEQFTNYTNIGSTYCGGAYYRLADENIYESFYNSNEGPFQREVRRGRTYTIRFPTAEVYKDEEIPVVFEYITTPDVPVTLSTTMNFDLKLDNSITKNTKLFTSGREVLHSSEQFSNQDLNTSNANLKMTIKSGTYIRSHFGQMLLKYPRTFNFSDFNYYEIKLNKSGSRYLELENLSGSDLILYDLSTNQRIQTTIGSITPIKTSSSSINNHLIFDIEIAQPEFQAAVNFENHVDRINDVLVIYNQKLTGPVNGVNYVEKFVEHKRSAIGGSWTVDAVEINQLYDQFAYGIETHPGAIKNFVLELKDKDRLPKYVILLGKGYEYQILRQNPNILNNVVVPTYGQPGSDSQLVTEYRSNNPLCSIGRVAAKNSEELGHYVEKVIELESYIHDTSDLSQTKDKLWTKKTMHLGGGVSAGERNLFKYYLNKYAEVYESPKRGGKAFQFFKSSTDAVEEIDNESIDNLMNSGLGLINYFGHSAPGTLEYNLSDPSKYSNKGKYAFMLTNGCYVGDLFQGTVSLSEIFVLAKDGGTITFMGPSQFGIAQGMNAFCDDFYDYNNKTNYGATIGESILYGINKQNVNSLVARTTMQQLIFHGDPTLKIYPSAKPDYLLESEDVIFEPNVISSQNDVFNVKVVVSNIGRAIDEEVPIRLTRTLPNGETEVYNKSFKNVYFQDTINFELVTNSIINSGNNTFQVEIDPESTLDEITRFNNQLSQPVSRVITSSQVIPVYLYEFGVTNDPNPILKASNQEFYQEEKLYEFQIDTTANFNSPLLASETKSSLGGTILWQPKIKMVNERVYYWRVKLDGPEGMWSESSFTFLENYNSGFNQSHYYQYLQDEFSNLEINGNRRFDFANVENIIDVSTGNPPNLLSEQIYYSLNGLILAKRRCGNTLVNVAVFDGKTGEPKQNRGVGGRRGLYSSIFCHNALNNCFNYSVANTIERSYLINFLNNVVSEGDYVLFYSESPLKPVEYNWVADNNSIGTDLFKILEEQGAKSIRNLPEEAPYVYFYKKGSPDFPYNKEFMGSGSTSTILESIPMVNLGNKGQLRSEVVGPAKAWDAFHWQMNKFNQNVDGDLIDYTIYGINTREEEVALFSNVTDVMLDISSVDAAVYPYLKVVFNFEDSQNYTAPQLDYFRFIYDEVPEIAIDVSDVVKKYPIELLRGEDFKMNYSINNLTNIPIGPVLVRYTVTKADGTTISEEKRYSEIAANGTLPVEYAVPLQDGFAGNNILYIDVNPDDDQLEANHFNNVAIINFEVTKESENPYLDVTFDGVHIIDGDLVSDEPLIIITLTDENVDLDLNNADDFEIAVLKPGETVETIYTADSPEITFYPADDSKEGNVATIEFRPNFEIGEHKLRVQARDRSGNESGSNDYLVNFEVTDEDIVSQIFNYPNPFTTQTQFIAKIIGDEPDEILIQIFSPSGQLVREIANNSVGINISQGNNFSVLGTWDGTDTYGDPVGNGVYYYKIRMKRGGEMIEVNENEQTSKYFHNGIGKLYILR